MTRKGRRELKEEKAIKVISFDPGLANLGWCVGTIDSEGLSLEAGVFKTAKRKGDLFWKGLDRRFSELADSVNCLFMEYEPMVLILEPFNFYGFHSRAVVPISVVIGMIKSIAHSWDVETIWISAIQLKSVVCGTRKATKEDVREKMSPLINQKSFDACDAAALIYAWSILNKEEYECAKARFH